MKTRLPLLAVLLFALRAEAAVFKINGHSFTVPDGFEVQLVAGPPLVDRPVSAAFDENGRLYVTDSSGANEDLDKQLVSRPHRVVRLEAADTQGRFTKASVFADQLTFPEGAMWLRGSLYVSGVPSIWRLIANGPDGVVGGREEWFKAKTLTHCGNDLHGPYFGPDGWIYWCKGAFAEQHLTLGNGSEFTTRASHIFRSRLDGSGLEPVMTGGMDNPVGLVFTPEGERILSGTFFQNPANGRRDGLIHAIYGGVYGKPNDVLEGHPRTGDLMPIMTHLGPAAACGLARYASTSFGGDYRNNLFAACFNLHKVTRHVLVPEGASYQTRDSDFLTCDNPDFHPTDIVEDADGSLLILDTGGWYKLCCPTSQLYKPDVLGAIYRVRRVDAPIPLDARGLDLNWEKMSAPAAVTLLDDPRPMVTRRAIARLASLGAEAVPVLAEALKSPSVERRRNAVWALTQIDDVAARAGVREALGDADESVSHVAAHSASLWRDAAATSKLTGLLGGKAPALQRVAAEALGRIGDKSATAALLAQTSAEHDRALEHSITYALLELADREGTAPGLKTANPRTQRDALLALDQMKGGGVQPEQVLALRQSPDAALRESAWFVVCRHSEWGAAISGFLAQRLAASAATGAERGELTRLLAQFAGNGAVQEMLVGTVKDETKPKDVRLGALRAMGQASLKAPPPAWLDELAKLLAGSDAELLDEAISTTRALAIPKDRLAEFTGAFSRAGRDERLPAETRLAALNAAPGSLGPMDDRLLGFLREQLSPTHPPMTRAAAAAAVGKGVFTRDQLLDLAGILEGAGPLEINRLLPAFESGGDEAVGLKVLATLEHARSVEDLRADIVRTWLTKFPASVQPPGETLLTRLGIDPAKQKAHLDELSASLKDGDIVRGQAVFNSQKASCTVCHAIGYLGGNFGPDLTAIGKVRSERDLLEAIVYPSASFVRSFEPFVVVTKSGVEQIGLLRKDSPEEIILALGPGNEVHIPRAEVAEMRPGSVSVMPAGFDQILSRQELADLIAFLKGGRW